MSNYFLLQHDLNQDFIVDHHVTLPVEKSLCDDSVHYQDARKVNDDDLRSIDLHSADLPSVPSGLISLVNEIKELKEQIAAISDWRFVF